MRQNRYNAAHDLCEAAVLLTQMYVAYHTGGRLPLLLLDVYIQKRCGILEWISDTFHIGPLSCSALQPSQDNPIVSFVSWVWTFATAAWNAVASLVIFGHGMLDKSCTYFGLPVSAAYAFFTIAVLFIILLLWVAS
jgi:hypothetical protein